MKQRDYITKEYLDERFEYYHKDIRQHMTDLKSGFTEQIKGVCDQIKAVDEKLSIKIDRVENRLGNLEIKVNVIAKDVILIKDVLEEKTDRSETRALEKRIVCLEAKNA